MIIVTKINKTRKDEEEKKDMKTNTEMIKFIEHRIELLEQIIKVEKNQNILNMKIARQSELVYILSVLMED